jgi:membrane-bound metal-dependent hydrolase YbcI (DUF457 family)
MLPPGHLAISYLLGQGLRKSWQQPVLLATIISGLAPDIDFVLLPFTFFNQAHRLFTHNLCFISLVALALTIRKPLAQRLPVLISAALGGALHLLIDACFDTNPSNGLGVPFFWPFSSQYFSPINLTPPPTTGITSTLGWQAPLAMLQTSLGTIPWELPFYGLAIFVFLKAQKFAKPL